jgi:hypothetical protein
VTAGASVGVARGAASESAGGETGSREVGDLPFFEKNFRFFDSRWTTSSMWVIPVYAKLSASSAMKTTCSSRSLNLN